MSSKDDAFLEEARLGPRAPGAHRVRGNSQPFASEAAFPRVRADRSGPRGDAGRDRHPCAGSRCDAARRPAGHARQRRRGLPLPRGIRLVPGADGAPSRPTDGGRRRRPPADRSQPQRPERRRGASLRPRPAARRRGRDGAPATARARAGRGPRRDPDARLHPSPARAADHVRTPHDALRGRVRPRSRSPARCLAEGQPVQPWRGGDGRHLVAGGPALAPRSCSATTESSSTPRTPAASRATTSRKRWPFSRS